MFLIRSGSFNSGHKGNGEWNHRDHFQSHLLALMAKNGRAGLNARQIADHLHQAAIRVRRFIAENGKLLKRTGNGAGTKFFLR